METVAPDLPRSQGAEIARLVDGARERGEADVFSGKRRWVRYNLPMRLEVSVRPEDPSKIQSATMHNISGGGFGFWSKHMIEVGTAILVREWSRGAASPWLKAQVTHCTIGIRGHLVGAVFEHPTPPEFDDDRAACSSGEKHGDRIAARPRHPSLGLQVKCALSTIIAGVFGAVAAGLICRALWPDQFSIPTTGIIAGGSLLFGGVAAWLTVQSELHFLEALREGIRQIAMREAIPTELSAAPSREMADLAQAFLDLGATWRRHQEDERFARQKLEELNQVKSNILSIVSHDLRTPLTSILLYAQMLKEELRTLEEEDQQRFLGIISDECTRLARLVDDLLEIQRLEAGRVRWDMQSRDISESIRACARLFEAMAHSKDMEFTVDCPESLPPVEADADKISQVLSNLLSNAMKYTPAGGKIRLSAQVSGKDILLSVSDTGAGIPRDKWDQIFDRFAQLANPNVREIAGCGLGLYIVKQIVEHHGGAVWVDSEVGRGSEFVVSLPTKAPRNVQDGEGVPTQSAGTIVVCDADPELAAMISQTLRQEKYEVRQAHSGARLLAQLECEEVDVVVTDLLLPDMHAEAVLEALTAQHRRRYGLVVHSYAGEGPELRRRGVDVFLSRPASREELMQAVQVCAPQRRVAAHSRVVLLIECERLHMKRFRNIFSEAGHVVLTADRAGEAGSFVHNYPTEILVTCSEALGTEWRELEHLRLEDRNDLLVAVICENVRHQERQWAESYGVNVVACHRGHEEEVVAAILDARQEPVQESIP